jgi:hypothetical protein
MTIFDIIPLKSAGQVKLGLTKDVILRTIGKPSDILPEKDCYQHDNIFFSVSYDQNDRVEYIEYSTPADDKTKVLLNGIDIFGTPADDLIYQITTQTGYEHDNDERELPYVYIFPDLELSFWRPVVPDDKDDEDGKYFMTVGIGTKGYYTDK